MNTAKAKAALNTLSMGLAELAEALDDQPERASSPASAPAPLPPLRAAEAAPDEPDHDLCPKHQVPWRDGRYGPFCSQKSDDPAWSKNGFCSITPKNAPKYLEIHAA